MIMTFEVSGELVKFRVNKEREVSMQGRMTNDAWVPFSVAVEQTKQDKQAGRLTELIIKSLPTMENVEEYVRYEMSRLGLRHVITE